MRVLGKTNLQETNILKTNVLETGQEAESDNYLSYTLIWFDRQYITILINL